MLLFVYERIWEVFPSTWAQNIQAVVFAVCSSGAIWLTHRRHRRFLLPTKYLTKLQPYDKVYDMLESLFLQRGKILPQAYRTLRALTHQADAE